MFGRVEIDGREIKAGITLDAFEALIERAGFDADRDLGRMMVNEIIELLRPTIEAHLQTKHYRFGANDEPIIIELTDLTTH